MTTDLSNIDLILIKILTYRRVYVPLLAAASYYVISSLSKYVSGRKQKVGDSSMSSTAARGGTDTTTENSSTSINSESLPRSVRKNGRFITPWPTSAKPTIGRFLKWQILTKNNTNLPSKQELDETLPVLKPDLDLLSRPVDNGIRVTWIGHATALVQTEGLSILTDPIFSARCAPMQFMGPKRFRPVPCSVHELPRIDAVLISHNHYDHLDVDTVHALNARFGAELRWFVGLGLADWMHSNGCENVIEMDWWQENCIPSRPEVRFVFTPAQHWCKRGPTDDNKALWGSWCMVGPKQRFFFAGDTAYCSIFELIGKKYGPFDLAAIPIGAYEPRWFMENQHVDPAQAVRIHQDVQAKVSLAIHWGTFALANEFYLEPPETLKASLDGLGLSYESFIVLKHGETRHLPPQEHKPQEKKPEKAPQGETSQPQGERPQGETSQSQGETQQDAQL